VAGPGGTPPPRTGPPKPTAGGAIASPDSFQEKTMIKTKVAILVLGIVLIASAARAQDWKGNGRMSGKVIDEQNKPLEGVKVVASLGDFGGVAEATTDKRGDWSIDSVADGTWQLTFEKDGYDPSKGTAEVDEGGGGASVRITLKKSFDPNAFIQAEGKKAAALMNEKKFAEARAVYQAVIAKVPEVSGPMQLNLAQTYYGERNLDKAVECLKTGLAAAPTNLQVKLMLANVLAEKHAFDEASQVLGTIDEASIAEPQIYLNFAAAYVNAQKPEGALPYLDKAVARFPQSPLVYYYRATALIEILNSKKDPKDPARTELIGRIKPDLEKFLQISPSGPEADQVRKLLEQIAK
jgi:tetratricopeptide (TPR) repeat protein